jgi:hypothetical protein
MSAAQYTIESLGRWQHLISGLAHEVTRGRVAGNNVSRAVAANGGPHPDLGGALPDALSWYHSQFLNRLNDGSKELTVVTETLVVGGGDGLAVVRALLTNEA